jgi:hypothetical protein
VVLPAVELDDQAAVRPREVDLFGLDEDVRLGPRETAVIEEGLEARLEVSAGVGRRGERAEGSGAALGRVAPGEVVRAGEAEDLDLVDGLLELVALQDAGQVEERAGGSCDGDAVPHRDLVRGENGSVKEEAWSLSRAPRHRQFDPACPESKGPECAGRSVAEHGVGRERGGHPASPHRERQVAHGVNPAVKGVEPTGLNSSPDRGGLHAGGEQLRPTHHPVLAPGERGDQGVRAKVSVFGADSALNSETLVHGADLRATNATEHPPLMPI